MTEPVKQPWELDYTPVPGTGAGTPAAPPPATAKQPWELEYKPQAQIYEPNEVLPAAGASIRKTGAGIIPAVTKAGEAAVKDPGGTASSVGLDIFNIIKTLASAAATPVTNPIYSGLHMFAPEAAESFKRNAIDPGTNMTRSLLDDLQDKYGNFLGGKDKPWGWTPKEGIQNLGRTIAERPISFGTDVVTTAVPALKGAKAGLEAGATTVGKAVGIIPKAVEAADAAAATQRLTDLGIKTSHLTPDMIERLRLKGNEVGWDKEAMQREYTHTLFDETGSKPTESMATKDLNKRKLEDNMREGVHGERAAEFINDADMERRAALEASGTKVREELTGTSTQLTPKQVGETLTERYNIARDAAKDKVKGAYEKAFDPAAQKAAGVPEFVPENDVRSVASNAHSKMLGNGFVATPETAPNAARAMKDLEEFAKTGRLPSGAIPGEVVPPGGAAGTSWQSVDLMRKYLNGLRESARANGTDLYAMRQVLDAFDETMGKGNVLLNDARKMHSDRVRTFEPDRAKATSLNAALKVMQNEGESGLAQFNKVFGSAFKSGEAEPAIARLKTIFANDPDAMAAMREGALQNLFEGKTYDPLSPKISANAIKAALNGPQGDIYRSLFTPEQIARLERHQEVLNTVGDYTKPTNPPRSGQVELTGQRTKDFEKKGSSRVAAVTDTIGSLLGSIAGGIAGHGAGPMGTAGGIGGGMTLGGMGTHYGPGRLFNEWLGPKVGRRMQSAADAEEAARAQSLINPPLPAAPRGPPVNYTPWPVKAGALSNVLSNVPPDQRAAGGYLRTVR
jgi:hypothetical protein